MRREDITVEVISRKLQDHRSASRGGVLVGHLSAIADAASAARIVFSSQWVRAARRGLFVDRNESASRPEIKSRRGRRGATMSEVEGRVQ